MTFLVHFLIGTVAASSIIAFNLTGYNVFPYFLKNMTLIETLSASYSAIPNITRFINNSTVGPFENSSAILNVTNAITTTPLNVTNATTPLNVTNTTTPLNVTNTTTPTTTPTRHSYLRYSRPPTRTKTSTPSRTSKYS